MRVYFLVGEGSQEGGFGDKQEKTNRNGPKEKQEEASQEFGMREKLEKEEPDQSETREKQAEWNIRTSEEEKTQVRLAFLQLRTGKK